MAGATPGSGGRGHAPIVAAVAVVAVVVVLGAGLAWRLAIVREFHASAGDGVQYYELSQEVARARRFAYGPKKPLAFTRLPGYPLFLTYLAVHKVPVKLKEHLQRATRANAFLDVGTALLVFLLLYERRLGWSAAVLGALGVVVAPLLVVLSTYALSDSLATFLTVLAVFLGCRAMRSRPILHGALAGVALGLLQLTRPDGGAVVPAVSLALLLGAASPRRRLAALAVCGLAAVLVFAPWPWRNLRRFHAAHPFGTPWVAQDGKPLPTGWMAWMQTWARGDPREEYLLLMISRRLPLLPQNPRALYADMYDSPAERARLVRLYAQYSFFSFSPAVDRGFRALARERRRRAPLRTWVGLPLRRLRAMWKPLPEYDFPMKSSMLQLPQSRVEHGRFDDRLLLLAGVGLLVLLLLRRRDGGPATAAVLATAIVLNSLVHVYAHPTPVQRYVAYTYPLLVGLGAFGLTCLARAPAELVAWARARQEPRRSLPGARI